MRMKFTNSCTPSSWIRTCSSERRLPEYYFFICRRRCYAGYFQVRALNPVLISGSRLINEIFRLMSLLLSIRAEFHSLTIIYRSISHILTEWRGWKRPLEILQSNFAAKAGSATAGSTRLWPGGLWIFPEKDTQPLWMVCSSALSPLR